MVWLKLKYGMIMSSILLHQCLYRTNFAVPPNDDVNDFFVGTWTENETSQLSLMLWLKLENGMIMSTMSLHLSLSSPNLAVSQPVNDFDFFVGTWTENETSQLSLMLWLKLEYGMVLSSISLHVSLSHPNLAVTCVNDFTFFLSSWSHEWKMRWFKYPNALTKAGVWNGNVFYLAACLTQICCPPNDGFNGFAFFVGTRTKNETN